MRQGFPIPKDIVFIHYDTPRDGLLDENGVIFLPGQKILAYRRQLMSTRASVLCYHLLTRRGVKGNWRTHQELNPVR